MKGDHHDSNIKNKWRGKNLPNGSQVIPADKSNRILRKGKAVNMYFSFNGNAGTEEFFDQCGNHIARKVQIALNNV